MEIIEHFKRHDTDYLVITGIGAFTVTWSLAHWIQWKRNKKQLKGIAG